MHKHTETRRRHKHHITKDNPRKDEACCKDFRSPIQKYLDDSDSDSLKLDSGALYESSKVHHDFHMMPAVVLFRLKHRLGHTENYPFSLSKTIFSASKYPKKTVYLRLETEALDASNSFVLEGMSVTSPHKQSTIIIFEKYSKDQSIPKIDNLLVKTK